MFKSREYCVGGIVCALAACTSTLVLSDEDSSRCDPVGVNVSGSVGNSRWITSITPLGPSRETSMFNSEGFFPDETANHTHYVGYLVRTGPMSFEWNQVAYWFGTG
ncbi:MAG: hypothetical protein JSV80_12815 [Acidobacteriota bacterium]|nr:MAG: hypothetical protein JSV80_12815 [Acidobacteriota bacterium]